MSELDPKKHVGDTKQFRKDLDEVLQRLKRESDPHYSGHREPNHSLRTSRERSVAITKIQEAIMWLGMDLKAMHEAGTPGTDNPYPESYNPASPKIEPTADGLKL